MLEVKVKATLKTIEEITALTDEYLEGLDCPMKTQMQLDVVIDELFSNIAQYAYGGAEGEAVYRVEDENGTVRLTFEDWGRPFNPMEKEDPDVKAAAESREEGGLGIFMVRRMTDSMAYERRDGKNILTVTRKIH